MRNLNKKNLLASHEITLTPQHLVRGQGADGAEFVPQIMAPRRSHYVDVLSAQAIQAQNRKSSHSPGVNEDDFVSSCTAGASEGFVASLLSSLPQSVSADNRASARQLILHPKEWPEFVLIIRDGWAVSLLSLPDGKRQILSFLLPGDIAFGGSLFNPGFGHIVEAVTEVKYKKVKREDVIRLLLDRSSLMKQYIAYVEKETNAISQLALELGRCKGEERIAKLIVRLNDKVFRLTGAQTDMIEFPLRQTHIADATGMTAVHVGKVLRGFQRENLIEMGSRRLTILKKDEMRRIAEQY